MLFHLILALFRGNRAHRVAVSRWGRLMVEELGQRIVPTTNTWIGPANGLWSNPANWSTGHTPQSTDYLYTGSTASTDDLSSVTVIYWINTGSTITVSQGCSINGQQYAKNQANGTIDLNSGSTIASDNYIYNYGTIVAKGNNMIPSSAAMNSPNVTLEPGSSLSVLAGTSSVPALSVSGIIENYGTLDIGTYGGQGPIAGVMSASSTINVESGGSVTLYTGSIYGGGGYMNNLGTVTMMGATIVATIESRADFYSEGATSTEGGYGDEIEGDCTAKAGIFECEVNNHALTITGNFTIEAATLSVQVSGTGGDVINVDGSVAISANGFSSTLEVGGTGLPPYPRDWYIIQSSGGMSGDFVTKYFPPPPPGFSWYSTDNGTDYVVGYSRS